MARILQLYVDDSGARQPDLKTPEPQRERDYFALGGVLVKANLIGDAISLHREFCESWSFSCPLRSHEIRMRRGGFKWLRGQSPEDRRRFESELGELIRNLPIQVIACVVDRPGYNDRYRDLYADERWMLCKTAFAILIERAAKFAELNACQLQIYFEQAGKNEDRKIEEYLKNLKAIGMPFNPVSSAGYQPLSAADFRRIVLGDPQRVTKAVAMCQIADLCLHAVAMGGYKAEYKPYLILKEQEKLIDNTIEPEQIPHLGIKYSCFDSKKEKRLGG